MTCRDCKWWDIESTVLYDDLAPCLWDYAGPLPESINKDNKVQISFYRNLMYGDEGTGCPCFVKREGE